MPFFLKKRSIVSPVVVFCLLVAAMAALAVLFDRQTRDAAAVQTGVFDGNQAGPGPDDPQQRDRYGVNFRVNDPPLVLAQIQYFWNNKKGDPNLAGSFKLGGWRNFTASGDLRFASNGISLASSESSGTPAMLSGDFGVWAVFEQQLYRVPKSDDRGIGVFGRVSSSPTESSLIDLYADAGIAFSGLSEARPNDKFGIAVGYAHVSRRAQALDADFRALMGLSWPQRSLQG